MMPINRKVSDGIHDIGYQLYYEVSLLDGRRMCKWWFLLDSSNVSERKIATALNLLDYQTIKEFYRLRCGDDSLDKLFGLLDRSLKAEVLRHLTIPEWVIATDLQTYLEGLSEEKSVSA